mmetsp:Transcript_73067/g.214120  ORF Transcript_73067/g.214120 Transcript_73067/m.214120 type:complete len:237 (+) Transcript_73067:947-1657(+)
MAGVSGPVRAVLGAEDAAERGAGGAGGHLGGDPAEEQRRPAPQPLLRQAHRGPRQRREHASPDLLHQCRLLLWRRARARAGGERCGGDAAGADQEAGEGRAGGGGDRPLQRDPRPGQGRGQHCGRGRGGGRGRHHLRGRRRQDLAGARRQRRRAHRRRGAGEAHGGAHADPRRGAHALARRRGGGGEPLPGRGGHRQGLGGDPLRRRLAGGEAAPGDAEDGGGRREAHEQHEGALF